LEKDLSIVHEYGAPYSHRHQGQVERIIRTFRQILNKFLQEDLTAWPQLLPYVQLQMNAHIRSTTNSKPFEILFARRVNAVNDNSSWQQEIAHRVDTVFPALRDIIDKKRGESNKYFAARHKIKKKQYKLGDIVLFRDPLRTSKFAPPWIGPYRITKIDKKEYEITDLADNQKRNTVTQEQIKEYFMPDDEMTEPHYEIEKILAHRKTANDELEYQVKWKNYAETTWEPQAMFDDIETLRSYHRALRGGV